MQYVKLYQILQIPSEAIICNRVNNELHCTIYRFLILFPLKPSYYLSKGPCWPNWLAALHRASFIDLSLQPLLYLII